jgi:membrane protease YdiL (CAAX protease family)
VLVLILTRRELGGLQWSRVREALWLRAPRDPKTGRVGGRVWGWALLFVFLFGLWQLVPGIPGPSVRDFAEFVDSDRGEEFFSGAWGWFAVIVVLAVFNTVLGEELLFRGLLLPRMRGVFGRRDWVANGLLFTLYHLHTPWVIPTEWLVDIFLFAYPSRRFQSAWMGIIVHSGQSVVVIIFVLTLVLA